MSTEVRLKDVLTPQELQEIEALKEAMRKAPNKAEVNGIAEEIYSIYNKVQMRYVAEEEMNSTQNETSVSIAY
ncbi:hypothetical protein [Bacillus sp. SM2101]|uniref:hypothetical protein n=1 Tax=Bacillus sp. SM2101 TaxID=2805366 RepID=UPI001BDE21B4|nr:hypothetical protein [Bacillus sp. SM2101]